LRHETLLPRFDPEARGGCRAANRLPASLAESLSITPLRSRLGTFPPATQISWARNAADTLAPAVFWEDAARLADALGPAARRDLLRVLTSSSAVRADVIRQLHERPDGQEMVDLLIFLEEWEWARQGMIEELSRA
jgi:hypothetical protein